MRLKLVVAYVGTAYQGWQLQSVSGALLTVQGQLEHALGLLAGGFVRVHGSGRTDAGVHAERQVCHCDFPEERWARLRDARNSLNALLPRDIRVFSVERVADDFHSRFDAHKKTYRYSFWTQKGFVPPALDPYVWCCGPLDARAMRRALPLLEGERDFAVFANAGGTVHSESEGGRGTVRTIHRMTLEERTVWEGCEPLLELSVCGSGFLKQMVRNMAGLLACVGRGRVPVEDIPGFLAAGRREAMPTPTAPAKGLTLVTVDYDG